MTDSTSGQRSPQIRLKIATVAIVASVFLVLTAVFSAIAISRTVKADRHSEAIHVTILATQEYVQNTNGKWPLSLDDLQKHSPKFGILVHRESRYVEFDFAADPKILARQKWDTFTGIRPHQPCHDDYRSDLKRLIQLLQAFHPHDDA